MDEIQQHQGDANNQFLKHVFSHPWGNAKSNFLKVALKKPPHAAESDTGSPVQHVLARKNAAARCAMGFAGSWTSGTRAL